MKKINTFLWTFLLLFNIGLSMAQGVIIPTGSTQADFLKAYKVVLDRSYQDYRFNGNIDSTLFPKFGEYSVYWAKSGVNRGSFILPGALPPGYSTVTITPYSTYNWQSADHYSIQFKKNAKTIAVFKSNIKSNKVSVSWESMYFKNTFDTYLFNDMYYYVNERGIDTANISSTTRLLIIPSFAINKNNSKFFIDSVMATCPRIKTRISDFLSKGGTIYAEGNAAYLIERLGYLSAGAVNFGAVTEPNPTTNLIDISTSGSGNPIAFSTDATGNYIYTSGVPRVDVGSAEVVARLSSNADPIIFVLKGAQAGGGRIICNLGLPTVGGTNEVKNQSRQLQWTLNTLLYAFSTNIDVTRSVNNDLLNTITAGKNAVAYDKVDTFEVRMKVRNLSQETVSGIALREQINGYFSVVDIPTPVGTSNVLGNTLDISQLSLPPLAESEIVYRLKTPTNTSTIHGKVDNYIAWKTYINASSNSTTYADSEGTHNYNKWNAYTDIMFSADIVADADLNWKNFLGTYYQPFKVFMIMENKERTSAKATRYTQYIPKDVPFYWVDHKLNIPILKTPGGKYVDVLRGSNDQNHPDFDMNGNGHPDVWLDTASIYPKGYRIVEDSVYWQNPWHRLATGDSIPYFEDIDHDGLRAQDLNNDGIPEIEEPGDKIRVWKVIWDINDVAGHQVFDPYCSYEIWVDPPDLVAMAAGVAYTEGKMNEKVPGMFYPYSANIDLPDQSNKAWTYWMDTDSLGQPKWTQMIYQSINNYEGYTFIDTLAQHYSLRPTDRCAGTVPHPHNEYIAVLSMGGEEIDMNHPTPHRSNYSNIDYKTIFNEPKKTPIRTTYTYYAPLPNPLQFEYLTNNFIIKDMSGNRLQKLPAKGNARITFNVDASTEYSYYWIRNAGHDVDYNDPSLAIEGIESLGDGVFGYMIYDIPKGFSDYKITLPRRSNGTFDINSIIQVDGHPYAKWIDNPNTEDSITIWEDDFRYHIKIPQLLIPPALCDKNGDGVDDWIDDKGDRFHSTTGYLHDAFMTGNGEDYPTGTPHVYPHNDKGMAGQVTQGWSSGNDNTYGSDFFDNLGKVHFTINAIYEGNGKEGPVDISKGGWLVVEEIFGGSPWVIFSHTLSAYAEGINVSSTSTPSPSVVRFGVDTCYIKHMIKDANEPHEFNADFDPYHVCYGFGDASVSTFAGGKDPCSLVDPAVNLSAIIDPKVDHRTLTLVPQADKTNPDLTAYPKTVSGSFVEAMITMMNGTDDNWINTTLTPVIPPELGNTKVVLQYVSYPRPLVPAVADPATGAVLHSGDQIGSFTTGWRFNQPDNEVIVKMGNVLNLLQPTRRAYFMFLISVDENLPKGVYSIKFKSSGNKVHYTGTNTGTVDYEVPELKFSINSKNKNGSATEFQKLVIGQGKLDSLTVKTTPAFTPTQQVKWSLNDVNYTDFTKLTNTVPATYNAATNTETIRLSAFKGFPSPDSIQVCLLEQGIVNTYNANEAENVDITSSEKLDFGYETINASSTGGALKVTPIGPRIIVNKKIYSVNGELVGEKDSIQLKPNATLDVVALVTAYNGGSDIAKNTLLDVHHSADFRVIADSLPAYCSYIYPVVHATMSSFAPGQLKSFYIRYQLNGSTCDSIFDLVNLISKIDIQYSGQFTSKSYNYPDTALLVFPVPDIKLTTLQPDHLIAPRGETMNLAVGILNGAVAVKNTRLKTYAVAGKDTVLISEVSYPLLKAHETVRLEIPYKVPEDATFLSVFTKIDSDDAICEVCENNNRKALMMQVTKGPWINKITVSPNPVSSQACFYYELGEDLQDLFIDIYAEDGKLVQHIQQCPTSLGSHSVCRDLSSLRPGTFYYRFVGSDVKQHQVSGKLIKD